MVSFILAFKVWTIGVVVAHHRYAESLHLSLPDDVCSSKSIRNYTKCELKIDCSLYFLNMDISVKQYTILN